MRLAHGRRGLPGLTRSSILVWRGSNPMASASKPSAEPASRTSTAPKAPASGPANRYPSGTSPSETIQS